VLAAGTLASRLLGMVRETMIAATFDVASTDAFFIAWRVPNALRALLAEGAATNVLNPLFAAALVEDRKAGSEARERLRAAVAHARGAALLVLAATTLLGVAFARPIFGAMAGSFGGDATRFELGVALLRILFPFIFFMGWFALGDATLRVLNRFRPGAFAPALQNVAFVVTPFLLMPLLGTLGVPAIYGLALAALVGGALQVLWIRPELARQGVLPRPAFGVDATVRELGRLFLPMVYGQAVYQLNIVIAGRFLSALPRGSASYFSYAQRLADIPQGLFSMALAGATSAALAHAASAQDHQGAARTYERALRMAAFVAVPLCVILAVYGEAVVPLIYGYGRFRALGTEGYRAVAASLTWQALSVAFMAFVHQTTAVFGAYRRRGAVVWIATASLGAFVLAGALATPRWGHVGVAFATACSTVVQLGLLLGSVRRLIPVRFASVGPTLAKVLAATGLTALVARAAVRYLPVTSSAAGARVLALVVGGALVALYLTAAWVLRCDEMVVLQERIRARLRRR
jgi:putative peptidoglycan lipid II flippase